MDTYEKKYKEAQKWVENIYPNLSHEQQMEAEAFFPELCESEDEKIRRSLIHLVYFTHYNRILKELNLQKEMPINASVIKEVKSDIIWFKSLRPQNTWKPSDEQITVLELASKYERVFTPKQIDILIDLKEQLKKLRGE